MNTKKSTSIICALALLGAVLVNTVGSARADLIEDLNNFAIRTLDIEPNVGALRVAFYVYADDAKTGDLKMWIKIRDWSQYKTIDYASAKKYTGKHDGEPYALASFTFPKLTRNLVTDSFQACVQTVATGEQVCKTHFWLPGNIEVQRVYMEAYSSGYPAHNNSLE